MQHRRVFVTGMGMVTPLGLDTKTTWAGIIQGHSGVDYITAFDTEGFDTRFAAEVKGFNPENYLERKTASRMDRFSQFAVVAALEACGQARLDSHATDPFRVGVMIGSGVGGLITTSEALEVLLQKGPRKISPFTIPKMLPDTASAQVSMATGFMGMNYCPVSSCSSGADAIGQAWAMIRRGQIDTGIAGGTEAPICPIGIAGFNALRALSRFNENPKQASRPFDMKRDGFVMGEGAAILVLESEESAWKRGVPPLAEVLGYGATSDAYHITEPHPEGEHAARAMSLALQTAGIEPAAIDYINAHGTSTPLNDRQETKAIKRALGGAAYQIPISSTKSMTGHLLGAGGALEAGICILAIRHSMVPPTINLTEQDPECDLEYTPNKVRLNKINVAMSNSFGFGGHNSVLIISRGDLRASQN